MLSNSDSDPDPDTELNPNDPPVIVRLPDYAEEELLRIFAILVNSKFNGKMKVDDGIYGLYSRILVRKVGRSREGQKSENIWTLKRLFSQVCDRQARRLSREQLDGKEPDLYLLTKEDMIGPEPSGAWSRSDARKELDEMVGLKSVKASIEVFLDRVTVNYHRELQQQEPVETSLNRVFLGPPGTGKTMVSKIYGQLLADLGLLSSGDVVIKNPSDFIGAYIGHSEKKTRAILEATKGRVLIIDDAYMLYLGNRSGCHDKSDVFRAAVVDTLVAGIQNIPGEDRCVILIGYTEPMKDLFQNCNPGLERRFPLSDAFCFTDFNDSELGKILDLKLRKQGLSATSDARRVALQVLGRARNRSNFGNGGEVDNLLSHAKNAHQKRVSKMTVSERAKDIIFEPIDFDAEYARGVHASNNCKLLFKDMFGCEDIIALFQGYQEIAENMRFYNRDPVPYIPCTFVFKGPPGTGKTAVARKVGRIFYDMGFLSDNEVIECSVTDLVAEHAGGTGPKVISLLKRALGKVLFIDEAYRLGEGQFANEALGELVDSLTKKRFEHKIVIILAGYDENMTKFMLVNRGLRSRFPIDVIFHAMRPENCLLLLQHCLDELGIRICGRDGPENLSLAPVIKLFAKLGSLKSWANGRDVKMLAEKVIWHVFRDRTRVANAAGKLMLSPDELIWVLESALESQGVKRDVVKESETTATPSAAKGYFDSFSAADLRRGVVAESLLTQYLVCKSCGEQFEGQLEAESHSCCTLLTQYLVCRSCGEKFNGQLKAEFHSCCT
jgi:SpoVK/Ycf46/Vps4 family AAA+-type ATPase